jgi:hypothetical protein
VKLRFAFSCKINSKRKHIIFCITAEVHGQISRSKYVRSQGSKIPHSASKYTDLGGDNYNYQSHPLCPRLIPTSSQTRFVLFFTIFHSYQPACPKLTADFLQIFLFYIPKLHPYPGANSSISHIGW